MKPLTTQEQAAFDAIRNHNLDIEPGIETLPIVATLSYGTDEDKARMRAAIGMMEVRKIEEGHKLDSTSVSFTLEELTLLRSGYLRSLPGDEDIYNKLVRAEGRLRERLTQ